MVSSITKINFEVRNNLTDGIVVLGANNSHMENILKKKCVSKKEMREALKKQNEYIDIIQNSKDVILSIIENEI
jgi:glycerol-3-phosphate cytidylyltransferase-like family protein